MDLEIILYLRLRIFKNIRFLNAEPFPRFFFCSVINMQKTVHVLIESCFHGETGQGLGVNRSVTRAWQVKEYPCDTKLMLILENCCMAR